jgi:crotonobetainyl-CoA:carnitine CoA-transferase CaiB-like acyl-CoA transferase
MTLLNGIRVLDLTRLLPGPLLTLYLVDLGAEVIKIEDTEQGDYLRWMSLAGNGSGNLFEALNRDKKGIKLNLKTPEGVEAFQRLSRKADIIVEGFRPGVVDKLGVGYDAIKSINPAIVYCSVSGYGKDGPYAGKAGHDLNYIGVAGSLGVTGNKDKPVIPGVQIGDIAGGSITAFGAIMLGLYHKQKTGKGLYLDISMVDGLISFMAPYLPYLKTDLKRGEMELTGSIPCYNVYRTRDDKFVTLGALEPKFWTRFLQMINRMDLIEEQLAKGEDFKRVYNEVQQVFLSKTRQEWLEFFRDEDVCVEPVNELDELLDDPHIKHRGMFDYIKTEGDKFITIRNPFYKGDPQGDHRRAPLTGEHTVEILKQAGYSDNDIEQMKRKGVI